MVSGAAGRTGMSIGGKYRLGKMLGRGGMGSVYAAENVLTGKRVAIKCVNIELGASQEVANRFMREAKASSRVRHPNVVDVYDVLCEGDRLYLIMELLEGRTLADFLAKETVPLPQLIQLLIPAMRGVAAAHRQGVIHRDVKPENIFLAKEGDDDRWVPKVLDFGISKLQGTQEIAITAPGSTMGTLLYMATEQLDGVTEVDARADVYAFGVILYQAITGRFPFYADTVPALVLQIFTAEPTPVRDLRGDVPVPLGELIARAMAKQRTQRVPSLDALVSELNPFANESKYGQWLTRTSSKPHFEHVELPEEPAAAKARPNGGRAATQLATRPTAETPFTATPQHGVAPEPVWPRWVAGLSVGVLALALGWWALQRSSTPANSALLPNQGAPETETAVHAATNPAPSVVRPRPAADKTLESSAPQKSAPSVEPPKEAKTAATSGTTSQHIVAQGATPAQAPGHAAPPIKPTAPPPHPPGDTATRVVPPARTAEPARTSGRCNQNFYFDAEGNKHFKRECF